jgi:hypothetical protein
MMNQFYMNTWSHSFMPLGFMSLGLLGILIALLALATLALKGYALWHAAQRNEKGWFVALLIVNSFGILELIYLYFVVKKWNKPHHHEHHHS